MSGVLPETSVLSLHLMEREQDQQREPGTWRLLSSQRRLEGPWIGQEVSAEERYVSSAETSPRLLRAGETFTAEPDGVTAPQQQPPANSRGTRQQESSVLYFDESNKHSLL
ncbi:hypothetical protein EYF80_054245 [Liparis tanakae]|uniref:Uncharacterized protein n=1 Tax=Liparis tanakae TaxID=230148 RepID=A0A4Z2F4F9_9TELE|nr:hypothetical protein EYF80_054245 [Liparis tanakae]